MALGAEATVNAKQVHRQRLLAARRTQDERVCGLGDLIRKYPQSAEDPDQMAAVIIGLPSQVLVASLRPLFCEAGGTVETASAIVGKYMGITEARKVTPEVPSVQVLAAEVPAVLAAGDLLRVLEDPVRRTTAEDSESRARQDYSLKTNLSESLKSELWETILPDNPVEALRVIFSAAGQQEWTQVTRGDAVALAQFVLDAWATAQQGFHRQMNVTAERICFPGKRFYPGTGILRCLRWL